MPAFLLALREGLEAALIVSLVLTTLRRLNRDELAHHVWLGVGAALLISATLAVALSALGTEFDGQLEAVFEGVTVLLAAAVLTWMVFWMQRQGRVVSARLAAEVQHATRGSPAGQSSATAPGRPALSLFSIAFLAVLREGVELALFLAATVFATSPGQTAAGAVSGLAAAVVLGVLLFMGGVRLDLRRFFGATSGLLIVFAAGMLAFGLHELIEAGLIPALVDPVYNINAILSDKVGLGLMLKTLLGYNDNPALTEMLAYLAYFFVIGWTLRIQRRTAYRLGISPSTASPNRANSSRSRTESSR